jgi:hypothetical protein
MTPQPPFPSGDATLSKVLRIFVSSPGDVGEERLMAKRVIGRLRGEFGKSVQLDPYLWEHEPMRATDDFQGQIPRPSACDIVVCMLWSRLGTRLPPDVSAEGKTGTEWEFENAAEGHRKNGIPDLLVYRKTKAPLADVRDNASLDQKKEQWKAVTAFFDRWFQAEDGTFKAAFKTFGALDEFEAVLESDLRKLIRERVGKAAPERTWHHEPFRGLQAFEYQHAPIFFGRTRAISTVKEQLVQQAARGCAFVLVFGMSGVGKSSLVRAGVLPLITQPGVIEGIGLWRWCVFRPSDAAADLAGGLAAALTAHTALPELQAAGVNTDQLAEFLRQAPEQAVLPLRVGLHRAAETVQAAEHLPRPPETRLALVVDQLEELFTLERVDERQRRGFVQALSALARSGLVWVIGTMRSDFYSRCAEVAELAALKEGAGQYDLLPPTAAELQQMIELPARAAGLRFEERQNGERLDHVLHEAASRDPRALPLLEFTLDELYKQLPPDAAALTFAAYEQLGGMEGALARRAEDEFARLSPAVQAALPAVFRALVTVRTGEAEVVVAQPAPKEKLQADADQRALVAAFVQARLLVSDKSSTGVPVVRLAHEALLHHWPRLKQWLVKDMDFLRIRARVTEAAAHWQAEGRLPELLLPAGKPLAEGEFLLARRQELDPAVVQYVTLSRQRAHRARQRRRWAVAGFVAVLLAGTILSITFAIQANANAERADEKANEAQRQKVKADAAEKVEKEAKEAEAARRKQAEAVSVLLESVFLKLDPRAEEKGLTFKEQLVAQLDAVVARLDKEFADQPLVQARLRDALGQAQLRLGEAKKAVALLQEALEERRNHLRADDPLTLASMDHLAGAYEDAGELKKALPLLEETLAKRKAKLGADDPDTLRSMNNLALAYKNAGQLDKALPIFKEALAKFKIKLGPDHLLTLITMNNLALVYLDTGQVNKALPLCKEVLAKIKTKLGPDHPDTLNSMNILAFAYRKAGQLGEAVPLYEKVLAKQRAKLGPDHPDTLNSMNNLANAYRDAGQLAKALPLYEEALAKSKAKLGPDHPYTLNSMNNLASAYRATGQLEKALPLLEENLAKYQATLGPDHPHTLISMENLANAYYAAGRVDKALPLYEDVLSKRKVKLGPVHPYTLGSMNNLAVAYLAAKEAAKALPLFRSFLAGQKKRLGSDSPRLAGSQASVSLHLLQAGQPAAAEPIVRECLAIREKKLPDSWATFNTQTMLGGALLGQKKYEEAEPLLLKGYEGMKKRQAQIPPAGRPRLTEALERLVQLYDATGQAEKAARWRKELAAVKRRPKK